MKNIYLITFLLLLFFSCKKEETTTNKDIPNWLLPKIESLENSGQCYSCSVTRITFESEYYYHLYCGLWSCVYCQVYDKNGELVDWSNTKFSDFLEKKTDETIIWKCNSK